MPRVDQLLVQRGLAPTRSAAQRLIERGAVERRAAQGWAVLRKSGEDLGDATELRITDDAELRWASRAGLKLEAALARTGVRVAGRRCLDLGQSTGGFTDVLLAGGAASVLGVEVGHGQLHPRLAADARVRTLEGLDVRDFGRSPDASDFDLVVGDLSFISQTLAIDAVRQSMAADGEALMLVKPQFELQPGQIGKRGLVTDPTLHRVVEQRIRRAYADAGLAVRDYFDSPVTGGDGNREFFVHVGRNPLQESSP